MIVTKRDLLVLLALARYFVLDRRHVQKLVFPKDGDGRVARRRLAALADAGLIRRHSLLVASSDDAVPAPVYFLADKGCQYLAETTGDSSYLYKPVQLPHPLHVRHHLAVTKLHMLLDAAIAARPGVELEAWFNETDVVNAGEPDPREHFRLVTRFDGEPTITCSPDAGFVLNCQGLRTEYYLELERGDGHRGTGPRQLAERKCPGYAELARHRVYEKHFPAVGSDQFRVLLVTPDGRRRDAIRQAFAKQDAAQFRTDLWRFAALTDITVASVLDSDIIFRSGLEPPERLGGGVSIHRGTSGAAGADTLPPGEIAVGGPGDAGPAALHEGPPGDARGGSHANMQRERGEEQQVDQQEQQLK
jgi:hypothetical protein